jgi:hypothetical protein
MTILEPFCVKLSLRKDPKTSSLLIAINKKSSGNIPKNLISNIGDHKYIAIFI